MGSFPFVPTFEIFTGNPATVNDPFIATNVGTAGVVNLPNGARMPLGRATYWLNPASQIVKLRYVRLNSTTPPALTPGPVYWKDQTFTIVTAVSAESTAGLNACAGILLNTSATNGNFVFIQTAGFNAAIQAAASTVAGDTNIPAAGATQTVARVAAGTAPGSSPLFVAYGAVAANLAPGFVTIEDFSF